jgi:hypothetical protein
MGGTMLNAIFSVVDCVQAITNDPTFIRLSKGAYSLHCFHPDKEQLVKAPQAKQPKESKKAAAAAAAGTPAPGSQAGDGAASTSKKQKRDDVPMIPVQAKPLEVSKPSWSNQWSADCSLGCHPHCSW